MEDIGPVVVSVNFDHADHAIKDLIPKVMILDREMFGMGLNSFQCGNC